MPHTGPILHGRYAVVSCHVERPLDDEVWRRFSRLQQRRPGRFAIAALMRPPSAGEDEERWLERARQAQALAPLGLHTHWTAPDHARPTGGGPPGPFRRQVVHAYFHDTDLLDRRRMAALRAGLAFLGLKRTATDLRELQRGLRPANTMSFANSRA